MSNNKLNKGNRRYISDLGSKRIANTRDLTKILFILKNKKKPFREIDFIKLYEVNAKRLKDGLNWLYSNRLIDKTSVLDGSYSINKKYNHRKRAFKIFKKEKNRRKKDENIN